LKSDKAASAGWYRYDEGRDTLVLTVRVQPNASRTEIAGVLGGQLKIRVAAPAIEHKANSLLLDFLKKTFELPGGRVMIRRGDRGRTKTIEISSPPQGLVGRLTQLLET